MNDRRAAVNREHFAARTAEMTNTTIMTDDTIKYGDTYEVNAIADSENRYVLGLREMVDKSASTCLSTFQSVTDDIETSTSTFAGKLILARIKNTMSDRAASEKIIMNC